MSVVVSNSTIAFLANSEAPLESLTNTGYSVIQFVPNLPTDPAREWGVGTVFGCGLLSGLVLTLLVAAAWIMIWGDPEKQRRSEDKWGDETARSSQLSEPIGKQHATPTMHLFWHRCMWLIGLLLMQSISAIVLSRFAALLLAHPNLVYFLTMLVGAGGNAGAQSAVLVVRQLALKLEPEKMEQVCMGIKISAVLAVIVFLRTVFFGVNSYEVTAIVLALVFIVMVSVILGTLLPLGMDCMGIDPAHSLPVVQVLMDILGVTITCLVGHVLLDRIFHSPDEKSFLLQKVNATLHYS